MGGKVALILLLILLASPAYAQRKSERFEIRPKKGTADTYIIRDRYGRRVSEARIKHPTLKDKGTKSNPYIIKKKRRRK